MIVDLERNDLNRICELKSVIVDEFFEVETIQQFSFSFNNKREIERRIQFVDLIKATFPGGSITGAPKIRAMEIIGMNQKIQGEIYTQVQQVISHLMEIATLNIVIKNSYS